jgi:hypothetical protein
MRRELDQVMPIGPQPVEQDDQRPGAATGGRTEAGTVEGKEIAHRC